MNILFIGGTGMLREAVLHYSAIADNTIYVLARKNPQLPNTIFLPCDYYDAKAFQETILSLENIDRIVAWMHLPAKESFEVLMGYVKTQDIPIYHLIGSVFYRPNSTYSNEEYGEYLNYRNVILGFNFDKDRNASYWLSHKQICNGLLEAIDNDQEVVIGETSPTEMIP